VCVRSVRAEVSAHPAQGPTGIMYASDSPPGVGLLAYWCNIAGGAGFFPGDAPAAPDTQVGPSGARALNSCGVFVACSRCGC
jgi:hypothetical protein